MRKIRRSEIYEGLKDPHVEQLFSYEGLIEGDMIDEINAEIIAISTHPESGCYWCVVERGGNFWEIELV